MRSEEQRVLVVGLGHMGTSHARAYTTLPGYRLAGLCARSIATRTDLPPEWAEVPRYPDFETALREVRPDVVSINTYSDTHAPYALRALEAGAHVFVEKPLAETVEDARRVVETARAHRRKVVCGYILRVHPAWAEFTSRAQKLGRPLVMRMNLNQQSSGEAWTWHRSLMQSLTPIVDCGVHYVDVMCRMTGARPVRVHAIGARLSNEVKVPNYGQLQVTFEDGSVGWYEAGWGPMMSETAFFVKDVVGPKGSISIVTPEGASADIETHTQSNALKIHHGALAPDGSLAEPDTVLDMEDEPGHDELCRREQALLLRAIEEDLDVSADLEGAVESLRIVLAADESMRTGRVVDL
ncbi:MAG: Gfo/Idh/MocA family oxidoreductase [Candidatus Dormibacteraeota bacterium]|nr:Gfo/Idh/MocA family oxidoreductase [Candidatus Dormibacteraeota bacterium]